jgi:hypothetical protein
MVWKTRKEKILSISFFQPTLDPFTAEQAWDFP